MQCLYHITYTRNRQPHSFTVPAATFDKSQRWLAVAEHHQLPGHRHGFSTWRGTMRQFLETHGITEVTCTYLHFESPFHCLAS